MVSKVTPVSGILYPKSAYDRYSVRVTMQLPTDAIVTIKEVVHCVAEADAEYWVNNLIDQRKAHPLVINIEKLGDAPKQEVIPKATEPMKALPAPAAKATPPPEPPWFRNKALTEWHNTMVVGKVKLKQETTNESPTK